MTMTKWDILGIEPTLQTSEIKRAYAKMLKLNHPEDDPAGFQQLRAAYESALQEVQIRQADDKTSTVSLTDIGGKDKDSLGLTPSQLASPKANGMNLSAETIADRFMSEVEKIYNDLFTRIDKKRWQQLLDSEPVWQLDVKQILNQKMLAFLMEHYRLPRPIWVLLNEYFFWTGKEPELIDHYPKNFINFLMYQIRQSWELRYDFFRKDVECDYDAFIDYREEAHRALMVNDLDQAEPYLSAAFQIFEEDPDLLRFIGIYYMRQGDWKNALPAFDRLIEVNGKDADGYLHRAGIHLKLGQPDKALADYERVLLDRPDDLTALSGLAQCHGYEGRLEEAKTLYVRIMNQYPYDIDARVRWLEVNRRLVEKQQARLAAAPGNPEALLAAAELYYELEQYTECCRMLEQLDQAGPLSSGMYLLWGRASVMQEQWEAGLASFNKALLLCEKEGLSGREIFIQKGLAYIKLDNPEAAIREFSCALTMNGSDADVLYHLADAYRLNRDYVKGVKLCTAGIAIDPSRSPFYTMRALCHFGLGNFRVARNDYQVVVEHEARKPGAWFRKSICHLHLSEYDEAKTSLQTALALGYDSEAYYYLAVSCFWNGDLEEALEAIQQFKDHAPAAPDGYLIAGDIYRAMGREEEAKAEYASGSDLYPDHYELNKMAAYCLLKEGTMDRLGTFLGRLHEINPQDEWGLLQLIRICIDFRDWTKGRQYVEQYLAVVKEENYDSFIWMYSGVILYYQGLYSMAADHLEKDYLAGPRGDTCSYLSMVYYELRNMEKAEQYARQASEIDPANADYRVRYEGIVGRKIRKGWFRWLGRGASSHKLWPSTVPLQRHELQLERALHFKLGATR